MDKRFVAAAAFGFLAFLPALADGIKGIVRDAKTGEEIIGATIAVKGQPNTKTISGLDGSFSIDTKGGACTLVCTCLGYRPLEIAAQGEESVEICMDGNEVTLSEAVVIATNPGVTESGARGGTPGRDLPRRK